MSMMMVMMMMKEEEDADHHVDNDSVDEHDDGDDGDDDDDEEEEDADDHVDHDSVDEHDDGDDGDDDDDGDGDDGGDDDDEYHEWRCIPCTGESGHPVHQRAKIPCTGEAVTSLAHTKTEVLHHLPWRLVNHCNWRHGVGDRMPENTWGKSRTEKGFRHRPRGTSEKANLVVSWWLSHPPPKKIMYNSNSM